MYSIIINRNHSDTQWKAVACIDKYIAAIQAAGPSYHFSADGQFRDTLLVEHYFKDPEHVSTLFKIYARTYQNIEFSTRRRIQDQTTWRPCTTILLPDMTFGGRNTRTATMVRADI
jgi:hypothetical protein